MKAQENNILNVTYDDLVKDLKDSGERPFRATQIFEWIYQKGATSFDEMKNLPKDLRVRLSERFALYVANSFKPSPAIQTSTDGTIKALFTLADGEKVETVLIPTKKRHTVCVSTQAGCKFGCQFCASGLGGFKRNLTTAEILSQILHIKHYALSVMRSALSLTHVVFMGVGEPLDNFDNVMTAIRIINDKRGLNIGARRITVSTCGLIPQMKQLAQQGLQIELAISLHGYDNASRNKLMPVNKTYPFGELMAACREYVKETNRQITFEYALIKNITCTREAVQSLKKAFKGLMCKMNLIAYNSVSEFQYAAPSKDAIMSFKSELDKAGIRATIRQPRGVDVAAACGQLRHTIGRTS